MMVAKGALLPSARTRIETLGQFVGADHNRDQWPQTRPAADARAQLLALGEGRKTREVTRMGGGEEGHKRGETGTDSG